MVHNGIEYGLMAAYAEGLNIIRNADAGMGKREDDAETARSSTPSTTSTTSTPTDVTEVWRRGSVIGSWLLDLTAQALFAAHRGSRSSRAACPTPARAAGRRSRRSRRACRRRCSPTALYSRFSSRGLDDFANRVLSAQRKEFGGHEEKPS